MKTKAAGAEDPRPVKLSCRGLWKIFGPHAADFLRSHGGQPSAGDLDRAHLIGAVRDATLEVREGEIFIVMGLSGSGKSTLVRCLSRLIEPTGGELVFDGKDLLKASEAELIDIRRHKMGMVFQHFALLPHLNVLENVAFRSSSRESARRARGPRAPGDRTRKPQGPRAPLPVRTLRRSAAAGGIARSLAVEPEIWFLDEPFSALDPLIRREMQTELMRLQSVLKKTIVFITHDFDEAIRLADRIAIMRTDRSSRSARPRNWCAVRRRTTWQSLPAT